MKPARSGSALVVVLVLIAVAAVAVTGWTSWANWRATGAFSLRPWDGAWWSPVTAPVACAAGAAGHAGSAAAGTLDEAVWGDRGAVTEAERWVVSRPEPAAAPAPAAAEPAAKPVWTTARTPGQQAPSAVPARRIEAELDRAETVFRSGLVHYRAADPQYGASAASRIEHLRQAVSCFAQVDNLLATQVEAYAGSEGHNPRRLGEVTALRDYNRRLFESARESEAAAAGYR